MLRQWLDRLERLLAASPLPIGHQLILMEGGPLGYESERASRQRAGDHLAGEVDRCGLTRVARMEMWTRMGALVPIHPDRDAVEEADPRHAWNGTGGRRRRDPGCGLSS
jgi:hypothetical protein